MHEEQLSIGKLDSKEELIDATEAIYGMLARKTSPGSLNNLADDLSRDIPNYNNFLDSLQSDCWFNKAPYADFEYDKYWDDYYAIVACENNIIIKYKDGIKNKEIFGEAFFLRALTYLELTHSFGRVPIIEDLNISYTVKLASFTEIYKFIEKDLQIAMNLLPKNNLSARIPFVTPNRGTAKAYLAELYLSWAGYPIKTKEKYSQAAKEACELIDSAGYFGMELLPDFANLWKKDHLFNNENIFSFYCDYINFPKNRWDQVQFFYEYGWFPATEMKFFNVYPKGYRKDITFETTLTFYDRQYDSTGRLINLDSTVVLIDKLDPCMRTGYRKFYYDTTKNTENIWLSSSTFGINRIYLLRFAQTILTYAEAMARSGQLNAKVYECVNQIRRRARNLPLTEPSIYDLTKDLPADVFADSVVWERAWELCAEANVRWNDLVRLEMVEKLPELRDESEGGPPIRFDKSVYFSPYPKGDLRLNPNLKN